MIDTTATTEEEADIVTMVEPAKPSFGAVLSRPDGTFVITRDAMPYHVIKDDPLHAEVTAYITEHPDAVSPEPSHEPTPAEVEAARVAGIRAKLDDLDRKAVRPLRAIAAGTATESDRTMLAEIEAQAAELRASI